MTFQTNFPLGPTKLPYVTVSAKGMSNGLSDIPNDGFDFGPDTLLGTSSKGLYGPPYTQTSGIQEAYNYGKIKYNNNWGGVFTIVLGEGIFVLNADVNLSIGVTATDTSRPATVNIIGQGIRSTMVLINQPNLNGIAISNPSSDYSVEDTTFAHFAIDIAYGYPNTWGNTVINNVASNPTGSGANSAISYLLYGSGGQGTVLNLNDMHLFTGNWISNGPTNGGLYVWGSVNVIATNSTFMGDRALALIGSANALAGGSSNYNPMLFSTFTGCYIGLSPNIYITGYLVSIRGSDFGGTNINLNYNSTTMGLTTNVAIEDSTVVGYNSLFNLTNATVNFIKLHGINLIPGGGTNVLLTSSSPVIAGLLDMHDVANTSSIPNLANNVSFSEYIIEGFETVSGTAMTLPTQSTTSGTTAGTVKMDAVIYRTSYKKYVITFSGYENDTTTNQTINYPLPFSTSAVITGNNTGLTISTTTSGITITSPNSTTTYSGIVIVEGY